MKRDTNTNLAVDYKEKDSVKALGAQWKPEEKVWYVPAGLDLEPFSRWLPDTLATNLDVEEAVKSGQFSHALGSKKNINVSAFSSKSENWIELQIGADPPVAKQQSRMSRDLRKIARKEMRRGLKGRAKR